MRSSLPVVILATADFDSPVWTNKQHLAVRLAASRPVVYIESFGLRRPTLSKSDLLRILRRLQFWRRSGPGAHPAEGARPTIVSPVVIPLHGARIVRRVNRWLIDRSVRRKLPSDYVLWSFSPITYGLEEGARAFVYHSVDLIHHQPHFPTRSIVTAERRAVRRADAVVASSIGVRDHLASLGAEGVHLWENVADTRLFSSPPPRRCPRAVFAGHLTPAKIDLQLLQQVADAGVDLVLCGPLPGDGTRLPSEIEDLLGRPHVEYLGNRTPTQLAGLFAECEVGLIPYQLNPYTEGVFPLKVYEYLAAGLAVVSTPLRSLEDLPGDVVRRAGENSFAPAVKDAVEGFDEAEAERRRSYASAHSWETRAAQAIALLAKLEAGGTAPPQ